MAAESEDVGLDFLGLPGMSNTVAFSRRMAIDCAAPAGEFH